MENDVEKLSQTVDRIYLPIGLTRMRVNFDRWNDIKLHYGREITGSHVRNYTRNVTTFVDCQILRDESINLEQGVVVRSRAVNKIYRGSKCCSLRVA